ncbi:hypothetical protein SeLEV6574_g01073 [Synchytrium endobioticum]|uniref:Uncharacterized protein n=1 Tax=Synchytrium endobioticum TaxID=286115 RepID=A0A507DEU2_9FUNG|nr:hypothetical protein SeLEV6574_g01073 [Synchytrium endobioticum]
MPALGGAARRKHASHPGMNGHPGSYQQLILEARDGIIDIRSRISENNTHTLKQAIADSLSEKTFVVHPETADALKLNSNGGQVKLRTISTMVLYDDKGLEIYDKITRLDEYYLYSAEVDIFEHHARDLIDRVHDSSVLIELGVGSMRKTKFIFSELVRQNKKNVTYLALDLSLDTLRAVVKDINAAFPEIRVIGLWGTYNDSLSWVKTNIPKGITKYILWLGSSIGNMTREDATAFFTAVREQALDVGDQFVVGIDKRNDAERIERAYNDSFGVTKNFIMNGLVHVNRLFGGNFIHPDNFDYVSRYNRVAGRHEAYYRSKVTQTLISEQPHMNITLEAGELINIEYSVKYSQEEVEALAQVSEFYHVGSWCDTKNLYDLHVFQKPPFFFPRVNVPLMNSAPSMTDWGRLWSLWDTLNGMISVDNFLDKPIELRHPFIFYFGHLPAFVDIQLSRALNEPCTEPTYYTTIFERGIDPDIEDPSKCHEHSEVPSEWPNPDDIVSYRDRVRARVLDLTGDLSKLTKRVKRVLFMCYEHEAMHCETFLYMLVQYPHVLAPKGISPPISRPPAEPLPLAKWIKYSGGPTKLGANDVEDNDLDESLPLPAHFTWDNERPEHLAFVKPFAVQSRPISVGEYFNFMVRHVKEGEQGWETGNLVPASWEFVVGEEPQFEQNWKVKTVFGSMPLPHVIHWPVSCSVDQASTYARIHGRRLPTETEIAHIRNQELVAGASGNIGYLRWCPRDVDAAGSVASVGDGWEMTSTTFDCFEGFTRSLLYPGYSTDFFDGKHNVFLGGSWATVPTIANRQSFRNWYRTPYPFTFSKFRLAMDLDDTI